MKPTRSLKRTLLMPLALVLNLSGCAANLPIVPPSPTLPAPPPVTTPQPLQSYSESVQQQLAKWQKQLMDTPLIPEPSNNLGRGSK